MILLSLLLTSLFFKTNLAGKFCYVIFSYISQVFFVKKISCHKRPAAKGYSLQLDNWSNFVWYLEINLVISFRSNYRMVKKKFVIFSLIFFVSSWPTAKKTCLQNYKNYIACPKTSRQAMNCPCFFLKKNPLKGQFTARVQNIIEMADFLFSNERWVFKNCLFNSMPQGFYTSD